MESMNSLMTFVGLKAEQKPLTFMEKVEQQLNCSYTNRMIGFAILLLLGLVCCFFVSILSLQ